MLGFSPTPPIFDIFVLLIGNLPLIIKHFKIELKLLLSQQIINLSDWIAMKTIVFLKLHLMSIYLLVTFIIECRNAFLLLVIARVHYFHCLTF